MPSAPHRPPTGPGPRVELRRSARRKRTVQAYREGDAIVVLLPAGLAPADEQRYVDDLVARVLRQEARRRRGGADPETLHQRAARLSERYLAPRVGHAPVPASVSWVDNQRRRWGSCSTATGDIRLSDRLRTAPEWVQDYVLLHELVHLVVPHHGPEFRALLDGYPQRERARGFLEGLQVGLDSRGEPGPPWPDDGEPDVD